MTRDNDRLERKLLSLFNELWTGAGAEHRLENNHALNKLFYGTL
jgi:hypothetical protein